MEIPYHRLPEGYLQVGSMLEHILQDAIVAKGNSHSLLTMNRIGLGASSAVGGTQGNAVCWNCDARHLAFLVDVSGCDNSPALRRGVEILMEKSEGVDGNIVAGNEKIARSPPQEPAFKTGLATS